MVVMKGVNKHEIERMLDFALSRGLELRFIETMPIEKAGADSMTHHYPVDEILARVRPAFRGTVDTHTNLSGRGTMPDIIRLVTGLRRLV